MSCPRFVQNAWKKDLCSNCFKGKEDHAPVVDNRARYLANLKEITKRPPPPSILKGAVRKNVSAIKVHFPNEESQVIGYGGDEFSDNEDEQDCAVWETPKAEEDPAEEEEDKNFQKLTESNTEFNKDPANLVTNGTSPKPVEGIKKSVNTPLKLGQVKSSNEGKQSVLVSVQPFGTPSSTTPLAVSRKTHLNNLLHDASDSLKTSESIEKQTAIVSTAKSDVISENKTGVHNVIQTSESKSLIDNISTSDISFVNNVLVGSEVETNVEDVSDQEMKDDESEVEDSNNKTEKLAESRLSSLIEGKKNQITRGTILTKSHEQAKTKRYFQLGPINSNEDISVSERLYKKLETNDKMNSTVFSKAKDTISMKTNIQHKNNRNLTSGLFSSKLMKKEFGIQSDLQLTRMKSIDYINTNESAINHEGMQDSETVSGNRDSDLPPVSFTKLLPVNNTSIIERTDKDEVLLINGVPAESREMAGEPDGRADSDDLDEPPPDLPTTPPPLLLDHIPRPSFLHNIPKEKPKLPNKPNLRETPPTELTLDLTQLDATPSDPSLSPSSRQNLTKRQAPKPPPTPLSESPKPCTFAQNPACPSEAESPPGRRERASSCSPLPSDSSSNSSPTPEPVVTRRSLSLSNETLVGATPPLVMDKKKSNKMRSTLRKFLRLASREEFKCEELGPPPLPPPRPRPEIIHPLDLNKSGVQVLRSDGSLVHTSKPQNNSLETETPSSPTSVAPSLPGRPSKPPPPPRSQSLDCALSGGDTRPARPPPPSRDLHTGQRLSDPACSGGTGNSVYVNLGEVRSAIAPMKPQRSASLREKDDSLYQTPSALQISENLYESLAPECDSSRDKSSLPYYGSETESDIYCPYTFSNNQGGEELRACKTRTVVHKSLEDNYGAVVVANHEALTQLLEQASQAPQIPPALRPIKSCSGLQWTDFTVDSGGGEVLGGRVFMPAAWRQSPVTLCLTAGQARLPSCFLPVTQFFDLVASQYLQQDKTELVQVSVAVLVRQQFLSLQRFVAQLTSLKDVVRESAIIMVQIVNGLKNLQAQGREEASLSHFVLSREEQQFSPRVCLLPHDASKENESLSLCQCAMKATELLSLPQPLTAILRALLSEERATSLTQAKSALEMWLWGPTHVPASADTQVSLQRWLDLERATVLQSLVIRRPLTLSCSDYCHLSFLVRTNAKVMADALSLLDRTALVTSS